MQTEFDIRPIKEIKEFTSVLHSTIIKQHSQYYLYNRQHELKQVLDEDKKNYLPLNHANLLLGRFCKNTINKYNANHNKNNGQAINELSQLVLQWQDLYNAGGTYDTFQYASDILNGLTALEVPVQEELAGCGEVKNAFIRIPYTIKAHFQVNIVMEQARLVSFFEKFISYFSTDPYLLYYIREIRFCRNPLQFEPDKHLLQNVKMVLVPGVVNSRKNPVIEEIQQVLISFFPGEQDKPLPETRFAWRVNHFLSLAQGNTNYKKFLHLLNIIDQVYDPETNYAYLKNN